ncbi:MAG: hypothetical protein M3068_02185 [Gemmatimonadota bacterium]|nr:hypothetical protein [Gemmatimonadota bacterium]
MSDREHLQLGRREFVRDLAYTALLWRASRVDGWSIGRTFTRPVAFASTDRAYHIVVIGDSIAWGQGLEERSKYPELVRAAIEKRLGGQPAVTWSFAHSGAVIRPDTTQDAKPPLPGEVPNSHPSITAQVEHARSYLAQHPITDAAHAAPVYPENVALVIMDGGINDVGITSILTMDPTISDPEGWVRKLARERCVERMRTLLPHVLGVFPNATVVVSGYYAIVSEATRLGDLDAFLLHLGIIGKLPEFVVTEAVRRKLARQSSAFYDETVRGLRDVVANAHALVKVGTPVSAPGSRLPDAIVPAAGKGASPSPPRAHFVDFGLTAEQSFGAPSAMLWGVPASDPLAGQRRQDCKVLGAGVDFLKCLDASMGHPNTAGAQMFAGRVLSRLECDGAIAPVPGSGPGRIGALREICALIR